MSKKILLGLLIVLSTPLICSISAAGEKEVIIMKNNLPDMENAGVSPVVFQHKAHTTYPDLKCESCHEELFVSKEGVNEISHKTIMDGEHCGRCHDEMYMIMCNNCHSLK